VKLTNVTNSGVEELQIAVLETPMMTLNKYKIRITGKDSNYGFSNYTDIEL
jgi:hypothetical protein